MLYRTRGPGGQGGWFQLSTLPSFLELLENAVKATKMIILFPNQWLHHQDVSHQLLGESAWNFSGDGSWWTPSQPSMQPMPQTAVLPPGGTMPQMMQTLICRLARTKKSNWRRLKAWGVKWKDTFDPSFWWNSTDCYEWFKSSSCEESSGFIEITPGVW